MRCLWLVLLASTALFSTADALWREEREVSGSTVETLTNSLKLTDELDEFFKAGKSADDVFKLLALDKADDLLANSKLTDWITYMKAFNRKTPAERTTVIATLTAHYGDDGVAKIVEAAKQVRTTSALAKRVQAEQTQRWLVDGKTPAQVFKLLKLDDAETQLFAQPQIVTWAKYFDDFYKVNPKDETTLFKFLKPLYDQATLAHMLIAAEKVPATKSVATRVQAELTSLWLTDKIEPADIFKLLKLDEVGMSLLKDPIFNAWVKYTDDFRKFHFGTKLTTISVLGKSYQDDVLAKMILSASKHSSTSEIAKRLYTEQRRNWYLSKFAPEHVFKLLRLDQGDIPPLENPLFSTWIKYMVYFSDLRPKEDVSLLTVLGKVYKERDLSQVLVEAYHVPQTKDLATNLLGSQLDRWLVAKRDPVEVFYMLHVEGATAKDVRKLLYNKYRYAFAQLPRDNPVRKLNLLARDALSLVCTATLLVIVESGSKPTDHQIKTRRNEERGANTAPVEALKSSLKTDDWLKAGNSADDVFKLLSLNNAADNLLANPKLSEWITYMKAFDQKNPTKKTTMVATLTTHYGDDGLAKIIEAAKQVPSTATMAKRLQSEQIQRWLAQEKSTDKVFSLLKLDNAGDDVFSQPQIQTWVKYVEGFYKTDTNKEAALFSTLASRYSDDVLVQLLIKAKNVPSTEPCNSRSSCADQAVVIYQEGTRRGFQSPAA